MNGQYAAGRRHHRRLILSLLALAVGVTFAVAAPGALAGPAAAQQLYRPWIMIKASPTTWGSKMAIRVSGDAWPIEIVGEFLTLSVQRKAPRGKWTPVISAKRQVQFIAPASWQGMFNTTIDWTGRFTGSPGSWEGSVLYESPETSQLGHYVDYSMTSAAGRSWAQGAFESGRTYDYSGTPVTDSGTLRWYFAAVRGDYDSAGTATILIPRGSYEGDTYHKTVGVLTEVEDGVTYVEDNVEFVIEDEMWLGNSPSIDPRPVLDKYGHMCETRVVHNDSDPTLIQTTASNWNLAPSSDVEDGFYTWGYKTAKKGVYRVRATIAKTRDHLASQSLWKVVTLK